VIRWATGAHPAGRCWIAAALAALAAGLATPAPAGAQGAAFSITPTTQRPYFVFKSAPGGVVQGQVRIVNVSAMAGQVALYAVDATTGQTSGAVYLSRSAPRRDVGAWIRVSTPRLTLGAHQSAIVPFSVQIPGSTRGGQHLGGVVAAPLQPVTTQVTRRGKNAFRVNVQEIAIVAVQVNLPGRAQQQISISSLSASGRPGYQTLLIGLANTGNTLLKGAGRLAVSTAGGKRVFDHTFRLDTFVPQTHIAFPVYVQRKRLPAGGYRATVTITYGPRRKLTRTIGFTISARQLRQTFGSTIANRAGGSSGPRSSVPTWALVLGGVALVGLGVGGSALYFRTRTAH
jgi:hypothetical protein